MRHFHDVLVRHNTTLGALPIGVPDRPDFTRIGYTWILRLLFHDLFLASQPPWPNGQRVGPLIRRLRVRIPQGVTMQHPHGPGYVLVL